MCPSGNLETGGAWLSSALVVRCWVKSRNERNPYELVATQEHSNRTAVDKTEEGGDDVKSSCPLRSGLHTYYNGVQQRGAKARAGANPKKTSQFRLQAATRLHEDGIASNRGSACRGEYVPGLCTHRPSNHESREHPKSVR